MGGFSPIHWIVIGVVALLLFGNRLPEVARSLGKAWNEFKRGLHDVQNELDREPPRDETRPPEQLQAPRPDEQIAPPKSDASEPAPAQREHEPTPVQKEHDPAKQD